MSTSYFNYDKGIHFHSAKRINPFSRQPALLYMACAYSIGKASVVIPIRSGGIPPTPYMKVATQQQSAKLCAIGGSYAIGETCPLYRISYNPINQFKTTPKCLGYFVGILLHNGPIDWDYLSLNQLRRFLREFTCWCWDPRSAMAFSFACRLHLYR